MKRLGQLDEQIALFKEGASFSGEDRPDLLDLLLRREEVHAELLEIESDLTIRHGSNAGRVLPLDRIQEALGDDEALVAWLDHSYSGSDHAFPEGDHWACVVRRDREPAWIQLDGTGDEWTWTREDVELPEQAFAALSQKKPDLEVLRALYRQRLEPIESELEGVKRLIVVPSGRMGMIPLEALTSEFEISYAPSGTTFAWLRQKERASKPGPTRLLALGDPVFSADDPRVGDRAKKTPDKIDLARGVPALPRLPGTGLEIQILGAIFDKSTLLSGIDATESRLEALVASGEIADFDYLHLATHARIDSQEPWQSALYLTQLFEQDGQVYDGRISAGRILRHWNIDAELVVLSACQTGLGAKAREEGVLGFAQALFIAGARSVVLSLWDVSDRLRRCS